MVLPVLLLLAGCKEQAADANATDDGPKEFVVNVRVEAVVASPMQDILILPGETEAAADIRLAAPRGGPVEWVGVTEGDRVGRGQTVARIDLKSLQAARDRAKANLHLADEQLRRRQALHEREVLAREELDQARTEQAVARTVLQEAEVGLGHGSVVSTLDGIVNAVFVDPGEFVGEGDPVIEIVNTSTMRINFNVPESDIRFLTTGQPAAVSMDAWPDSRWNGQVDFVAWKADPATRTFRVRVIVDNADGRIRPGMIARAAFLRRTVPDAMTAPLFAIQDKGGERVVFVEENGVARARTVAIGIIEGDRVQIISGLQSGDRLIVAGQAEVEDGTRVNVR